MPSKLIRRLLKPDVGETKLALHPVLAAVHEYLNGRVTRAQIYALTTLDSGEQTDADTILDKIENSDYELEDLRSWFHLGEFGTYTQDQVETLLGL